MPQTMRPRKKTTKLEIAMVVVGMSWVIPGNPRTTACSTTSTMTPARSRISGGIMGPKSSIKLECLDMMTTFSNRYEAAEKLLLAEPDSFWSLLHYPV